MLVRFCPENYHPFNASNIEQYVIYETHKSINEMPSFKKNMEKFGHLCKANFEDYLMRKGHDVSKLWRDIDEVIIEIMKFNEDYLVAESLKAFNSTKNFFELLRFDFLMDKDMSLYLMEVNMSPNLTPLSDKYEKNAKLREKMIYDTLNLVGVGSRFDLFSR
jgi:tubulin monoglycylase TTLL15